MTIIPNWAPNIHPLLIHFPIVLLVLAPLLDVAGVIFKKQVWLIKNANLLYALAGLSLIVVYISGRLAADSVDIPSDAYTTLSTHANWALYTLIFGGINAVLRGYQLFQKGSAKQFQWYLIIPGLVVAALLFLTADNGAKLVYSHGVGVSGSGQQDHHQEMSERTGSESHHQEANGMNSSDTHEHSQKNMNPLSWSASRNATDMDDTFEWILGDVKNLDLQTITENQGSVLAMELDKQEVLFVFSPAISNLEFQAKLNRDQFNGVVRLVHHVTRTADYDFLELGTEVVKQGRILNGKVTTFDTAKFSGSDWVDLKVVSTKGHFRGYADQNLLTHGHGADLPAGKLGLYVKGSGTIKLAALLGKELK